MFHIKLNTEKTRGTGLQYGESFTILTSTVFIWSTCVTDGQTDRW